MVPLERSVDKLEKSFSIMALEAAPKSAVLDFLRTHREYIAPIAMSGPYAALVEGYRTDHPVVTEIDRDCDIIARAAKHYGITNHHLVDRMYSFFHFYEPCMSELGGRFAYTDDAEIHVDMHGDYHNIVSVSPREVVTP